MLAGSERQYEAPVPQVGGIQHPAKLGDHTPSQRSRHAAFVSLLPAMRDEADEIAVNFGFDPINENTTLRHDSRSPIPRSQNRTPLTHVNRTREIISANPLETIPGIAT